MLVLVAFLGVSFSLPPLALEPGWCLPSLSANLDSSLGSGGSVAGTGLLGVKLDVSPCLHQSTEDPHAEIKPGAQRTVVLYPKVRPRPPPAAEEEADNRRDGRRRGSKTLRTPGLRQCCLRRVCASSSAEHPTHQESPYSSEASPTLHLLHLGAIPQL